MLDHVRAGTGRDDDVSVRFFEHTNGVLYDRSSLRAQTGVEGGLSTAGLIGGEVHGKVEAAENADDRLARLRVERVDEAGDEELHCRHKSIVIRFPSSKNRLRILKIWYDTLL